MPQRYDVTLFQGAAEFYARFRPKYPQAVFDYLQHRFGLDRAARVLDLGCGTGNASQSLAACVGSIVAMDPDPEMIKVARNLAQGLSNIEFRNEGSQDLGERLGRFRLVVMGQSFHWMDRDSVLRDLYPLVEEEGGLALIGPAHGLYLEGITAPLPKPPWQLAAEEVVKEFVGERPRHPRSNPGEPRHEPALLRSRFTITDYNEFESERSFEAGDVAGLLYSMSGNLRGALAGRIPEFEAALRQRLLHLDPGGQFVERARTGLLVARKT